MPNDSEDMYGDGGSNAPVPKEHQDSDAEKGEGDHEEKEEGKVYPLPIEVLEGKDFDVGDEVVLRITGIHDRQVFLTYSEAPKEKGMDKGHDEEEEMAGAGGGGNKESDELYG